MQKWKAAGLEVKFWGRIKMQEAEVLNLEVLLSEMPVIFVES